MLGSAKNRRVSMNENAPFIREIIDRTSQIKGERVKGDNAKEIKANVQTILKVQLRATQLNARTQTY